MKIEAFYDLGVAEANVKETYLPTFLACWLCKFLLLSRGINLIRPIVFKVASKMTQSETFNLVVSVLANIYKGLNEITCSSKPKTYASSIFPINYLYRWLGEYFDTHFISPSWNYPPQMTYYTDNFYTKCFKDSQVQALIMSCKSVKRTTWHYDTKSMCTRLIMNPLMLPKHLISWVFALTIYIYDKVTIGWSNHIILTSFPGSLGILKTFQGGLPEIFRIWTLEAVYQHWESCTRFGTYSKVNIPDYHSLEEFSITKAYEDWYIRVCNPDKEILTTACMEPPSNSS